MTPKEDSEVLLTEVKSFAEKMLREQGEFHPFGGMMRRDGQVIQVGADSGKEFPPAGDLIALLADAFHQQSAQHSIRAAAIVANVSVTPPHSPDPVDAIRISIDHESDYSVHVFFPYVLSTDNGLTVQPPFATRGRSFAFRGEKFSP